MAAFGLSSAFQGFYFVVSREARDQLLAFRDNATVKRCRIVRYDTGTLTVVLWEAEDATLFRRMFDGHIVDVYAVSAATFHPEPRRLYGEAITTLDRASREAAEQPDSRGD
jgi:hypothetical protein